MKLLGKLVVIALIFISNTTKAQNKIIFEYNDVGGRILRHHCSGCLMVKNSVQTVPYTIDSGLVNQSAMKSNNVNGFEVAETSKPGLMVSIGPNPTATEVTVRQIGGKAGDISKLEVLNYLGEAVFTGSMNGISQLINLEQVPAGVYMITLLIEGKRNTFRIIKS